MSLGEWDEDSDPTAAPDTAGVAPLVVQLITDRFADVIVPVVEETIRGVLDDPKAQAQLQAGAHAAVAGLFAPPPPAPTLHYRSVDEFVRGLIVPVFRRNVGPRTEARWSARWWESAEAIMRLEAMWRAWEALRHEPAVGISNWLRDHADHHMSVLLSPHGPFARSLDEAKASDPLPYSPPPNGLFALT